MKIFAHKFEHSTSTNVICHIVSINDRSIHIGRNFPLNKTISNRKLIHWQMDMFVQYAKCTLHHHINSSTQLHSTLPVYSRDALQLNSTTQSSCKIDKHIKFALIHVYDFSIASLIISVVCMHRERARTFRMVDVHARTLTTHYVLNMIYLKSSLRRHTKFQNRNLHKLCI